MARVVPLVSTVALLWALEGCASRKAPHAPMAASASAHHEAAVDLGADEDSELPDDGTYASPGFLGGPEADEEEPEVGARDVWRERFKRKLARYSRRWVSVPFLPLRAKPHHAAPVAGRLIEGHAVWVRSIDNNWAELRSGGYVPAASLSPSPPFDQPVNSLSE